MNLPKFLRRTKPEPEPLPPGEYSYDIQNALAEIDKPVVPKLKSKGRVIKQTRHSEFNPNPVKGGRVVKIMPRNLQKIKQAQEKFEDDERPSVADLED